MDIIRAKTDKAMNIAVKQLDGSLSDLINNTRQEILNTLAQVEVNIDYPEYDDVEEATTAVVREKTMEFEQLLPISLEQPVVVKSFVKEFLQQSSAVPTLGNQAFSTTSCVRTRQS